LIVSVARFSFSASGNCAAIRRRAEQIYFRNGCIPGHDLENWAQAEREIFQEFSQQSSLPSTPEQNASPAQPSHRTAVVVDVNGVQYVGEYTAESLGGYLPGEFAEGASIALRFDGDKMFLQRPNGQELETTIVRKIS
jgi:hypothetical protein